MSCKRYRLPLPFPSRSSTLNLVSIIPMYANEARIVWNGPLQHEADEFLTKSLDRYFGDGNEWHFYMIDKHRRLLVTFVSKVVDRLM